MYMILLTSRKSFDFGTHKVGKLVKSFQREVTYWIVIICCYIVKGEEGREVRPFMENHS